MKTQIFINWTEEDFTHTWDGKEYAFPAGSSNIMEDALAIHFAKHLADRELNKEGKETGVFDADKPLETSSLKGQYMAKALGAIVAEESDRNVLLMKSLNTEKPKKAKKEDEINPAFKKAKTDEATE